MKFNKKLMSLPAGVAVFAFLALAGLVGMLAVQSVMAQGTTPDREALVRLDYDEDRTDAVYSYSATDVDDPVLYWTLGGPDAADFMVEGIGASRYTGVLRFKSQPDFENPADGAHDLDGNGTVDAGEGASDNIYRVTLRFGGGGEDGLATPDDPNDDYDGDDLRTVDLVITVMNVDEPGTVTLSPLQPQVGTQLEAMLDDLDVQVGFGEWRWSTGPSKTGPWNYVTDWVDKGADSLANTYRPVVGDRDDYLRVEVRYKDRESDDIKDEQTVSNYPVRKDIVTSNADPTYPDQSSLGVGTPTDGVFPLTRVATNRYVAENAPAGTLVGAPVTAFDDATTLDILTYSLFDNETDDSDTNANTPANMDGHSTHFDIDPATGQIMVAPGAMLNLTTAVQEANTEALAYMVQVRAVDGDGDENQSMVVTITVLPVDERPMIARTYAEAIPAAGGTHGGQAAGARVPTEMTHYEDDNTARPATAIDTDLDSSVLAIDGTFADAELQPAIYTATDPEDDNTTLMWSLAGPDADIFGLTPEMGAQTTLAFKKGPDFEAPGDANKNNVYEVTIVVTDSTGVNMDTRDVTVKVINSTEDNTPGEVKLSNRQPEGAALLTATLEDADAPWTGESWQWYRSVAGAEGSEATCGTVTDGEFTPTAALFTGGAPVAAAWAEIDGETSDSYRPKWDEDGDPNDDAGKCLLATVEYVDSRLAADATNPGGVETAHAISHNPVVVEDDDNAKPEFHANEDVPTSALVSEYRTEVVENATLPFILTAVMSAIDDEADPKTAPRVDAGDDVLTYTLSGPDAEHFEIIGSVDNPATLGADATDGQLSIKDDTKLDYDAGQREYRLTVTATDPSGDSDSVNVIVSITNYNESPELKGETLVRYVENGTGPVATYQGTDPENAGMIYDIVESETGLTPEITGITGFSATDIEDHALFTISSLNGALRFREPANFEKPQDVGANNRYQVTVRVTAQDPLSNDPTNAEYPRKTAFVKVTVIVTDENEVPEFKNTPAVLEITENPDDAERDPLLNRGVGKPNDIAPEAPNLDVGIPVVATDDDNTSIFASGGYGDTNTTPDHIDSLHYELTGTDAGLFDIVPATGQILTREKLNYEARPTYTVTVRATDRDGETDSIRITIRVTDIVEQPVIGPGQNFAPAFAAATAERMVAENTAAGVNVGAPIVAVDPEGDTITYTVSGDQFSIDSETGQLMTKEALDYETMSSHTVTVTATDDDPLEALSGTIEVTVNVTNMDERGTITLTPSTGGQVGVPLTAELSDEDGVVGSIEWLWYQVPMAGSSTPITGARAAVYTPVAADAGNRLRVTASYTDGEGPNKEESFTTTDPIAEANAPPEFGEGATASRDVAENMASGTLVGSAVAATDPNGDILTYSIPSSGDAASFIITSGTGQLATAAVLNHEAKSSYAVTITATDPSGAIDTIAVTVNVTNVNEDGMITLSPARPSVGTMMMAMLTDPDGSISNVTWQWAYSTAMGGPFTAYPAETTANLTPQAADEGRYLRISASYTDALGAQTAMTTTAMPVTTVPNHPGVVTLSTMEPVAGVAITASLTDANGSVTGESWQWQKSMDMSSWMDITGATGMSYMPVAADDGYYLRATVMYTDGHGPGQSAMSGATTSMVTVDPTQAIIDKYDSTANGGNGNGRVDIAEILNAIDDYREGRNNTTIAEILTLIDTYRNQAN